MLTTITGSGTRIRSRAAGAIPMGPVPAVCLSLLVVFKLGDYYTTLAGLQAGAIESNPFVTPVIHAIGPVGGLALMSIGMLAVIITAVELGMDAITTDQQTADAGRFFVYMPLACVYAMIVLHNLFTTAAA